MNFEVCLSRALLGCPLTSMQIGADTGIVSRQSTPLNIQNAPSNDPFIGPTITQTLLQLQRTPGTSMAIGLSSHISTTQTMFPNLAGSPVVSEKEQPALDTSSPSGNESSSPEMVTGYLCTLCGKKATRSDTLKHHITGVVGRNGRKVVTACPYRTEDIEWNLAEHVMPNVVFYTRGTGGHLGDPVNTQLVPSIIRASEAKLVALANQATTPTVFATPITSVAFTASTTATAASAPTAPTVFTAAAATITSTALTASATGTVPIVPTAASAPTVTTVHYGLRTMLAVLCYLCGESFTRKDHISHHIRGRNGLTGNSTRRCSKATDDTIWDHTRVGEKILCHMKTARSPGDPIDTSIVPALLLARDNYNALHQNHLQQGVDPEQINVQGEVRC
jgi:hypothetical protein